MDVILSIYNYLLLILFCLPLAIALMGYLQTKRPVFLMTCLLFVLYMADNLVIYMTEVIESFSDSYDLKFMTVPAFKTLIYAGTFLCLVKIIEHYLDRKTPVAIHCILATVLAVLLFIPLLPNSALKVWCYYFPCQVFTFILGLYTLNMMKKQPERESDPSFIRFRKLALLTVVFSVLIVIEDTIVIFNFDIYDNLIVKINNRSLTEDILSIIYSIAAIRILAPLFQMSSPDAASSSMQPEEALKTDAEVQKELLPSGQDEEIPLPETADTPLPLPEYQEPASPLLSSGNAGDYSKFFLFCREYQLTTREQDIFKLLLENKNNTEISESLFISLGTVKAHVHNIFSKLEVSKRHQLIEKYESFQAEEEEIE